jgi:hypothetical protein
MLKRLADFCTNLAVASFAIGLYKDVEPAAIFGGAVMLTASLILTKVETK